MVRRTLKWESYDLGHERFNSNESKTNIKVFPIEVKSSKNYTTVSYNLFKERFGKRIGESFIIHPKQLVKDENGLRIPPYMFIFII